MTTSTMPENHPEPKQDFTYWAFISYSHRDEEFCSWLHNELETYKTPPSLVGKTAKDGSYSIPEKLYPIFRDRAELAAGANVSDAIRSALENSRYLVVICSETSAKSPWVNREIEYFSSLGRERYIVPIILNGEPNSKNDQNPECFPCALREPKELVSADARSKDKKNALMQIRAGLLGVGLEDLVQRELRRQKENSQYWIKVQSWLVKRKLDEWAKNELNHQKQYFQYWAFISYSHRDEKFCDFLYKNLDGYRPPFSLVGEMANDKSHKVPAKLYPIFRDRDEFPASSDLEDAIHNALKNSRYLVVICSPNSAQSLWVNEEIKYFISLGREKYILPIILEGEPNSKPECFPPALRTLKEPLAADARKGKDGRDAAVMKLRAGLLGVGLEDLVNRELKRQKKQMTVYAVIAVLMLFLAVFSWFKQQDEEMVKKKIEIINKDLEKKLIEAEQCKNEAFQVKELLRKCQLPSKQRE